MKRAFEKNEEYAVHFNNRGRKGGRELKLGKREMLFLVPVC